MIDDDTSKWPWYVRKAYEAQQTAALNNRTKHPVQLEIRYEEPTKVDSGKRVSRRHSSR